MKKIFLLVLVLAAIGWGATYYVSSSSGSNTNDGLSSDAPKQTLAAITSTLIAPGDSIKLKCGDTWRETWNIPESGTNVAIDIMCSYGDTSLGKPCINGSDDVSTSAYEWRLSSSGTNEYYLCASGGGTPSISAIPSLVWVNGMKCDSAAGATSGGSIGSLWNYRYKYGNNDGLAFNTIYMRFNSGDPDTSNILVEISNRQYGISTSGARSFWRFDGLKITNVTAQNFRLGSSGNDSIVIENCLMQESKSGWLTCQDTYNSWIKRCTFKNAYSTTASAMIFSGSSSCDITMTYCQFIRGYYRLIDPTTTAAGATVKMYNCVVYGSGSPSIYMASTSTAAVTATNCLFIAPCFRRLTDAPLTNLSSAGGTLTIKNCYYDLNSRQPSSNTGLTGVTDNGGNITTSPPMIAHSSRNGSMYIQIDDGPNFQGFLEQRPFAKSKNVKLSFGLSHTHSNSILTPTLWDSLAAWVNDSNDVSLHSLTHWRIGTHVALAVRYVGTGSACVLTIDTSAKTLTTTVTGGPGGENLSLNLTSYATNANLIQAIDGLAAYTAAAVDSGQHPAFVTDPYRSNRTLFQPQTNVDIKSAVDSIRWDYARQWQLQIMDNKQQIYDSLGFTATTLVYPAGGYSDSSHKYMLQNGIYFGRAVDPVTYNDGVFDRLIMPTHLSSTAFADDSAGAFRGMIAAMHGAGFMGDFVGAYTHYNSTNHYNSHRGMIAAMGKFAEAKLIKSSTTSRCLSDILSLGDEYGDSRYSQIFYTDSTDLRLRPGSAMLKAGDTSAISGIPNLYDLAGKQITGASGELLMDSITIGAFNDPIDTHTTPKYTISYSANGGSGTQTDPSSPYDSNSTVTVLDSGTISRSGYSFNGWNTASDGSGTNRSPGATFTISGNVTLYAKWSEVTPAPQFSIHVLPDTNIIVGEEVFFGAIIPEYTDSAMQGRFEWEFGDGYSLKRGTNPKAIYDGGSCCTHFYMRPGDYSVKLRIINRDSTSFDSVYTNIHVTGDTAIAGFELLRADYHCRTAQFITIKTPSTPDIGRVTAVLSKTGFDTTLFTKTNPDTIERFLLNNSNLTIGNYTLTVTAYNSGGETPISVIIEKFSKKYAGAPAIGINEYNAICLNGEPYFPVTPWLLNTSNYRTWQKYTNCMYGVGYSSMGNVVDSWKYYLDSAAQNSLKFIGPERWYNKGPSHYERNSDYNSVINYIEQSKNKSALLSWMWGDEPSMGGESEYTPSPVCRGLTYLSHYYDSLHPVTSNLLGYDFLPGYYIDWAWHKTRANKFSYYGDGIGTYKGNAAQFGGKRVHPFDITGFDVYPIDFAEKTPGFNDPDRGVMALYAEAIDRLGNWNYNLIPIMSFLETCDVDQTGKPSPTAAQLKMEIWLNVVHGVKGINWFHYFGPTSTENYAVMEEFKSQMDTLGKIVLSAPLSDSVVDNSNDRGSRVDCMIRKHNDDYYLFAVRVTEPDFEYVEHDEPEKIATTFTLPAEFSKLSAYLPYEDRILAINDGEFADTFDREDVHIYRLTDSMTVEGPSISTQPQSVTVCVGDLATFDVSATGTGTLHYQWWRKRSGDSTTVGSDRNGYATYTWQDGDSVWVVITDDVGSVKSTRVKITNSCIVYRGTTTLSANDTVRAGEDMTLSLKGNTTTGDYNQIFDCSGGNIFVKADSASGFIHNGSGAIKVINSSPTRKVYFTSRNDNTHGIADSNSTGTPARNEKLTPWIRSSGAGVDSLDGIEVWYSGTQLMKFVGTDSTKKVYVKNGRWKNNTLRAVAGASFIVNDSDNIANLPGKLLVLERDSFDVSDTSGHQHRMVHTQDNCDVRVADCNFEWANTGSYFFVLRVDNWNTTSRRSRIIVKRSSFKQRAYDSLYGAAIRQLKYASTSAIDSIDSCTFDNLYLGILGSDSSLSGSIAHNTFSSNDFAINIPSSPNLTIDYNTFSCNTKNARIYNDAGDLAIGLNNSYLGNPGPLSYAASPVLDSVKVRLVSYPITNAGGVADSFTISPELPSRVGLSFGKTTGTISGLPLDSLNQTDFKIKGYSSCGNDSCTFRMTVSKVLWILSARQTAITGVRFRPGATAPVCSLSTSFAGAKTSFSVSASTDSTITTATNLPTSGYVWVKNSLGETAWYQIISVKDRRFRLGFGFGF